MFRSNLSRTLVCSAVLGACMLTSAPVLAQSSRLNMNESPFYGGFNIGNLDIDDVGDGTAFRLMGGYRFGREANIPFPLAVEAHYLNGGKIKGLKSDGFGVDLVPSFELAPRFSLLGRLGFSRLKAKAGGGSDTDTDIKYGFGAQYQLNKQMALRGEMEFYQFDDSDIDFLSVGLTFNF